MRANSGWLTDQKDPGDYSFSITRYLTITQAGMTITTHACTKPRRGSDTRPEQCLCEYATTIERIR